MAASAPSFVFKTPDEKRRLVAAWKREASELEITDPNGADHLRHAADYLSQHFKHRPYTASAITECMQAWPDMQGPAREAATATLIHVAQRDRLSILRGGAFIDVLLPSDLSDYSFPTTALKETLFEEINALIDEGDDFTTEEIIHWKAVVTRMAKEPLLHRNDIQRVINDYSREHQLPQVMADTMWATIDTVATTLALNRNLGGQFLN